MLDLLNELQIQPLVLGELLKGRELLGLVFSFAEFLDEVFFEEPFVCNLQHSSFVWRLGSLLRPHIPRGFIVVLFIIRSSHLHLHQNVVAQGLRPLGERLRASILIKTLFEELVLFLLHYIESTDKPNFGLFLLGFFSGQEDLLHDLLLGLFGLHFNGVGILILGEAVCLFGELEGVEKGLLSSLFGGIASLEVQNHVFVGDEHLHLPYFLRVDGRVEHVADDQVFALLRKRGIVELVN